MKRIGLIVLLVLVVGLSAVAWANDTMPALPSLAAFDEDVAVCRRVVRQYCVIVQQMALSPTVDKTQQAEGLELLAEARKQWKEIQSKYASNPPTEYVADKAFSKRLRDFDNALDDMERALAVSDVRRSFLACSFGCGLFVTMHEQNGLNYALDRLYHLRKDIKTTAAVMKTRGLEAVRARVPGLLQKRDAVLQAPPPFPLESKKAAAYLAAIDDLSRTMDQLALAVAAGDTKQIEKILEDGLMLANKPYGIAL